MKLIQPSFRIVSPEFNRDTVLERIESAARLCYKSEGKICPGSAAELVNKLVANGHEAMIEHAPSLSVLFTTCRGVTHEIVRSRLFSFAQESTRYVKYGKDSEDMVFMIPPWIPQDEQELLESTSPIDFDAITGGQLRPNTMTFLLSCGEAEVNYNSLIRNGWSAQQAREVLPNSLKAEILVTGNLRQWRNFLKLRCDPAAHPQMRQITIPLLNALNSEIPELFSDILSELNIKSAV